MKKRHVLLLLFTAVCFTGLCSQCSSNDDETTKTTPATPVTPTNPESSQIIVAYVQSEYSDIPNCYIMTHINYAFAHVNGTFNGIDIDKPSRLKEITALKTKKASLKVLLSIGGWGSGGFSEMASREDRRNSFAAACKKVIDQYNLDGIDIDWEYPTISWSGIKCSADDTDNYTLMIKAIRNAIGTDKLLTLASNVTAKYINFRDIEPYVDFVNIMLYDINRPPKLSSPLHQSPNTGSLTASYSVEQHVNNGMPLNKLVLGMPFYGRSNPDGSLSDWMSYASISILIENNKYKYVWDDVAKEPYLVNSTGVMECSFEDEKSIAEKCKYIKNKKMKGIMYWQYDGDDAKGTLRKAIYDGMLK